MLNYTKKKRNKLNTCSAVRENIKLNTNNSSFSEQANNLNYENMVFQIAEINLTQHLNNHKKGLSGKMIVRWWEN